MRCTNQDKRAKDIHQLYNFGCISTHEQKNIKKANKSEWWMPWLREAMKDVISCEKSGVGANNLRSRNIRMGQPGTVKLYHPVNREANVGN